MNREKTSLDVLYESCTPFDEERSPKTRPTASSSRGSRIWRFSSPSVWIRAGGF